VHFAGFPPQLFDLETDPDEFHDLGQDPAHRAKCEAMHRRLTDRLLARKNRVGLSDEGVAAMRASETSSGVRIGEW